MPMTTYPFEQECVFVFDHVAAATAVINSYVREESSEKDPVRDSLRGPLLAGEITPYQIASSPEYQDWIRDMDLDNVSDAHDLLSDADIDEIVHCSEFEGSAEPSRHFAEFDGKSVSFDNDFALFIVPDKESGLFSAAYASPSDLMEEYKEKLMPFLGEDFPYGSRIMDVTGTYFC